EKRPFSRRFASTHTPVPSQYSSFSRVRSLLMKQNTAPLFGSSASCSATALHSPLNCLRMSTGCTATKIRTAAGKASIASAAQRPHQRGEFLHVRTAHHHAVGQLQLNARC